MTIQNSPEYIRSIYTSLEQKKLKEAFNRISFMLLHLQNWQLKERLTELEDTYKTMLRYLTDGVKDPEREKIHIELLRSTYRLTDSVVLELKTRDDSAYFYEKRRTARILPSEASEQLLLEAENISGKIALADVLSDEVEKRNLLHSLEKESKDTFTHVFNHIWLNEKWSAEEKEKWEEVLKNKLYPVALQCLIISAATLNLQETWDEKKALLLLDACENTEEEIRQRALTGVLLFLRHHTDRIHIYPTIDNRLQHLAEDKKFIQDIRNIILQFILSRETEKITRKIKEEILPEMMKISPELSNKIKLEDLISETGMDEKNPEWQDLLEKAGLKEKLQEFSELQMEGADVMHSSFTHLKTYSFFNEISNWFVPFSPGSENPENDELSDLVKALTGSSILCNSDKYSFYYSIMQMPDTYKKMMIAQFSSESNAMKDMLKEDLPDTSQKVNPIARQYIQDLYRFHKIHPRKKDFEDIFEVKPDFHQVPPIARLVDDHESLMIIGEYYFNRNYFKEAAEVFDRLLQMDSSNDTFYQKKGYCLQMQGKLNEALDAYLKAELFHENNSWTIKKIAYCYKALKFPEEALLYYRKAEQLSPDNLSIQLSIGHCFLELKNYPEALKCYFKVEYLDNNKEKAWRPIAWCSFLTGKYNQAMDYFNLILTNNPGHADYLNAGHTQLAMGNVKEAIHLYELSVNHSENSMEKFKEVFAGDVPDLIQAGIQKEDIPFILDRLMYSAEID